MVSRLCKHICHTTAVPENSAKDNADSDVGNEMLFLLLPSASKTTITTTGWENTVHMPCTVEKSLSVL